MKILKADLKSLKTNRARKHQDLGRLKNMTNEEDLSSLSDMNGENANNLYESRLFMIL